MSREPLTASAREPVSPWERAQVGLLVTTLGWTTYGLGGYRPETMLVTSLLTGLLLIVHLLGPVFARAGGPTDPGTIRFHPAGWLVLPFLTYAAANVAWVSPVPWLGWRDWLGWAQGGAVFWIVLHGVRTRRGRATLLYALLGIAVLAVVLAAYQRFVRPDWLPLGRVQSPQFIGRASAPFGIPNSLAGLLILLLPAAGALAFRRGAPAVSAVLFGYVTLVLATGLILTISRGAWLALAAVLLAWPLWGLRRSLVRRAALATLILLLLAGTGLVLTSVSPRVQQRLAALRQDRGERSRPIIWRGAWAVFRANPVLGAGAGSFSTAFERHRPADFPDDMQWAHNEYLHLLCDYGVLGFVLLVGAAGTIGLGGARAARRDDAPRRGGVALRGGSLASSEPGWPVPRRALGVGLAAFALQLLLEFHLKIPALALAFAIVAALWVQLSWRRPPAAASGGSVLRNAILLGFAFVVAGGLLAGAYPTYRAEAWRLDARRSLDRLAGVPPAGAAWAPVLTQAQRELRRATALDPSNAAAWADLAYAIELGVHLAPGEAAARGREAEDAARRALLLAPAVPEFWIRRGVALDLQQRWVEAGDAIVQALTLAPARGDFWYQQASHLARSPEHRKLADAAAQFALRLDPSITAAQALRERLTDPTASR
jgi:O-antigen ligase